MLENNKYNIYGLTDDTGAYELPLSIGRTIVREQVTLEQNSFNKINLYSEIFDKLYYSKL